MLKSWKKTEVKAKDVDKRSFSRSDQLNTPEGQCQRDIANYFCKPATTDDVNYGMFYLPDPLDHWTIGPLDHAADPWPPKYYAFCLVSRWGEEIRFFRETSCVPPCSGLKLMHPSPLQLQSTTAHEL